MTETALPVSDALTVKDGEIPLPPPEMWAELDNSGTAAAAIEAVPEPAPSAKPEAPGESPSSSATTSPMKIAVIPATTQTPSACFGANCFFRIR